MSHHVIYLPGVGDHKNSPIQTKALEKWRKFGLEPHFQLINWNSSESFESKLGQIIKIVDELSSQNHTISLVGASAGASMAMNIYSARKGKISAVVLICGKINRPETLGVNYKTQNPALLDSVTASAKNAKNLNDQDKAKMLTILPIFDEIVAKSDGVIPGVKNKTLFSVTHGPSIGLALTLYKQIAINFIKSKSVQ
jgi:predicted peptidase